MAAGERTASDAADFKRELTEVVPHLRAFARGLCGRAGGEGDRRDGGGDEDRMRFAENRGAHGRWRGLLGGQGSGLTVARTGLYGMTSPASGSFTLARGLTPEPFEQVRHLRIVLL